ncbi:hypothetical protein ACVJBD_007626 [Rhizobium mongolense]
MAKGGPESGLSPPKTVLPPPRGANCILIHGAVNTGIEGADHMLQHRGLRAQSTGIEPGKRRFERPLPGRPPIKRAAELLRRDRRSAGARRLQSPACRGPRRECLRLPPVRQRGSGACLDTWRSNRICATTTSTSSVFPASTSPPKLNSVEPSWYVTRMPGGGEGTAARRLLSDQCRISDDVGFPTGWQM